MKQQQPKTDISQGWSNCFWLFTYATWGLKSHTRDVPGNDQVQDMAASKTPPQLRTKWAFQELVTRQLSNYSEEEGRRQGGLELFQGGTKQAQRQRE